MNVGVALPFWLDRPPLEALDVARHADRLGFPELWIGEMATFDAFALAGALALATSAITLTVGPLPVALRDPAAMAMGVGTVSAIGGRPAHLALGSSTPTLLADWHGVAAAPSLRRFRETVALCRALFAGERTDLRGQTVGSTGFRLRTGAAGSTVAIAAFGPRLQAEAARLADRVVLAHVTPEQTAVVRARLDGAAADAGQRPPELVVYVAAARQPEGYDQIARALVVYVPQPGYGEMFAAAGFGELVSWARTGVTPKEVLAQLPPELVHAVAAVGSVADVLHRVDAHCQAGAGLVCLVPATAGDDGAETLLTEVAVAISPPTQ